MLASLAALTPMYLLANVHCTGMCGPLVFCLGRQAKRYYYFLGRICGFTLAGALAASLALLLDTSLAPFSLAWLTSILCGAILLLFSLHEIGLWHLKPFQTFHKITQYLATKSFNAQRTSLFLIGMATLLLPCGQSIAVLSLSALMPTIPLGAANGLLFALLTSPGLILAMHLHKKIRQLRYAKACISFLMGGAGLIAILRGLADAGFISHIGVNFFTTHLTIY